MSPCPNFPVDEVIGRTFRGDRKSLFKNGTVTKVVLEKERTRFIDGRKTAFVLLHDAGGWRRDNRDVIVIARNFAVFRITAVYES